MLFLGLKTTTGRAVSVTKDFTVNGLATIIKKEYSARSISKQKKEYNYENHDHKNCPNHSLPFNRSYGECITYAVSIDTGATSIINALARYADRTTSTAFNSAYGSKFENSLDETLSNYSAANIAYNSGSIDASVNTVGLVNRINGISTSAVGAVNTGGISVTVK